MKLLLMFGLFATGLQAAVISEQLPDIDVRHAAPAAAAVPRMKDRGARVEMDRVLGRPAFLTRRGGLLTGPDGGLTKAELAAIPAADPHRVVKAYLNGKREVFGHDASALAGAVVTRDFTAKHNGLHTTVWQQETGGIPIFEAVIQAHVTRHGELVNLADRFIADPSKAAGPSRPAITAADALVRAAASLELTLAAGDLVPLARPTGKDRRQKFHAALLAGEADAKLIWLPMNGSSLRLCWDLFVTPKSRGETFRLLIDAENGTLHLRRCLTESISDASYRVHTGDSPSPFSPGHATPLPAQPPLVARELVTFGALDIIASPDGWIPDGTNETSGNNVDAHTDLNFDNAADLQRPQGSPDRVFDFAEDLALAPSTHRDASTVQLFYWCNWMHDRLYQLGFDEAAGNFQNDNFGRGGVEGDALQADAQDGGGFNNANMTTLPDGNPPRMQMYLWNYATPQHDGSLDAEIVLHEYAHGMSYRLVGGGTGISALQTNGLGEGWSDFYALALLSQPGEDPNGCYAVGAYAGYIPTGNNYYFGIRRYPYSADMTKSPLTFGHLTQQLRNGSIPRNPLFSSNAQLNPAEVHNQGEIWCAALWEVRSNLIAKHGFATGNELALQLVTDGMKLSPPDPNFLQARDAIIQADVVNSGGANHNELWAGFAKRGMGSSAWSPDSSMTAGVIEAFDNGDDLHATPEPGFAASGTQGGPFLPACQTYTLTNQGAAPLDWAAVHSQSWLDATPASGQLAPGGSVTVSVCVNAAANALSAGNYSGTLAFRNTLTGAVQERNVALDVLPTQRVVFFPLNTDPGWAKTGAWAFGHPNGLGGGGTYGFPDPTSGATGTNVYGVNLNGNYSTALGATFSLTTPALDLAGKTGCVLEFQRWLNSDASLYVQADIHLSTNGTTWTRIWANGLEATDGTWNQQHVNIAALADNQPAVRLRWSYRILKTGARPMSGWNIDDIAILANSVPPADTDSDGMPDAWEQLHFGHPVNGDPALDSDHDGTSNLAEYEANTDPGNAASVFRITGIARDANSHPVITWSSVGGVRYRVQFSDSLQGSFTDVVRPPTEETDPSPVGTASTRSFTDEFTLTGNPPAPVRRFYRIKVVP